MTKEEAIAFMRKVWRESMKGSYAEEAYEMAIEALKERPKGEWIEHEHGFWTFVNDKGERDGWIPDYECNLCGARAWKVKTKFCPTCGAEMRGECDENR